MNDGFGMAIIAFLFAMGGFLILSARIAKLRAAILEMRMEWAMERTVRAAVKRREE